MVNKIELNKAKDDKLQVIGIPDSGERASNGEQTHQGQLALGWSDEWRDAIYAKIVAKVGDRRYWEDWAADIAQIADRHVTRITALLEDPALEVSGFFDTFLGRLGRYAVCSRQFVWYRCFINSRLVGLCQPTHVCILNHPFTIRSTTTRCSIRPHAARGSIGQPVSTSR